MSNGQGRVLLPLLAIVLGTVGAVGFGGPLTFGAWAWGRFAGAALSLSFVGAGVVALLALWRKATGLSGERRRQGERANVALFVIWSLLLGVTALAVTGGLYADVSHPSTRITGRVEHLHASRSRGVSQVRLKLDASPTWLSWSCTFGCGAYKPLRTLADAPWPMAEAYRLDGKLIGLTINGRTYLEPARERARLIRSEQILLGGMGITAMLMSLVAIAWFRGGPSAYDGLDPLSAARVRDTMRRVLPDPSRSLP